MPRFALPLVLLFSAVLGFAQTPASAPPGAVIGVGNFIHVVSDLDKSVAFYQGVLGLEPNGPMREFALNGPVSFLYHAPGAPVRVAVLRTGFDMNVELAQFKDTGTPVRARLQDPGATNLILTVRDLESIMARAKKAGVEVASKGGEPSTAAFPGGNIHVVFLKDPDGFSVELVQRDPAPEPAGSTGNVLRIAFGVTVADTEKTLRYYHDVLGFDTKAGTSFSGDKGRMETAGTIGAQYRRSTALIPGTSMEMEFLEFKDIDRKPLKRSIHDPGSGVLRLRVKDFDATESAILHGGGSIASEKAEGIVIGKNHFVITEDLNNLFVQILAPAPAP